MGTSWIDRESREVVFCLPMEDSNVPNVQWVWDYLNQGWRLRTGLNATGGATYMPGADVTLVAGVITDKTGTARTGVFALNRGYPNQVNPQEDLTATYQSGWQSFGGLSAKMHGAFRVVQGVLTAEERSSDPVRVSVWQDWNADTHQGEITTYALTQEDDDIPLYGEARYGESVWRARRNYGEKLALDLASQSFHSVKIETEGSLALYNIDVWGPKMAGAGSRTPTGDD